MLKIITEFLEYIFSSYVILVSETSLTTNSSSCTTTVLSKLLTSCHTAVKNIGLDTMILFMKGTELTIFGQLKIPLMFSINLNLRTFRLLNCLHMIFLHCILRYLIIL